MTPALARRGFAMGEASYRRLLATWLAVVCAVGGLVVIATSSPPYRCHGETKRDIARLTIAKYVYEAMPSWLAAHPRRTCPDDLADLNEWMNNKNIRDPWDRDYRWTCRPCEPFIVVASAGPDGRFGTSDDLGSDR